MTPTVTATTPCAAASLISSTASLTANAPIFAPHAAYPTAGLPSVSIPPIYNPSPSYPFSSQSVPLDALSQTMLQLSESLENSYMYPKGDIVKFNGDENDYLRFEHSVSEMEQKIHDDGNRLSHLINKATTGDAYNAICTLIQRKDKSLAYLEAKQRLKTLFGCQSMIVEKSMKKVTSDIPISDSVVSLRQLSIDLFNLRVNL